MALIDKLLPVSAMQTSTEGVGRVNRNPFVTGAGAGEPIERTQQTPCYSGINTNLLEGSEIGGQTQAGYKLGGITKWIA